MSAFISLVRTDCIEIASDGALYDGAGRLMGVKKKAIAIPEVPMAVFGRGSDAIVGTLSHLLNITMPILNLLGQASFDEVMKHTEQEVAPKLRDRTNEAGGIPDEAQSEIIIAGFSEELGPCATVMRTFGITYDYGERGAERMAPWRFYQLPAYYAAGPDISQDIEAMGLKYGALCRDGLAPYAVDLLTAMRKRKDVNPLVEGDEPMHGVGGHVQLVTVTRDDARSEILHTWDDPIGELIDPFRSAA